MLRTPFHGQIHQSTKQGLVRGRTKAHIRSTAWPQQRNCRAKGLNHRGSRLRILRAIQCQLRRRLRLRTRSERSRRCECDARENSIESRMLSRVGLDTVSVVEFHELLIHCLYFYFLNSPILFQNKYIHFISCSFFFCFPAWFYIDFVPKVT